MGKPRTLDSEVVIEIADEGIGEINVSIEPEFEEPEDDDGTAQVEETQEDAEVEAIIGDDNLMDVDETIDEYGEKEDYADEYLTISNGVAQEPPACNLSQHGRNRKDF